MSREEKIAKVEELRQYFLEFTEKLLKLPGAPGQMQNALLRFDEGHLWAQNAILSYVDPQAALSAMEAEKE